MSNSAAKVLWVRDLWSVHPTAYKGMALGGVIQVRLVKPHPGSCYSFKVVAPFATNWHSIADCFTVADAKKEAQSAVDEIVQAAKSITDAIASKA